MLIQFEKLRGVRTVSIRALARAKWIKDVKKAVKTPRSEEEEAVRLEGWLQMGIRAVPGNEDGSEKKQGSCDKDDGGKHSSEELTA
jgi:hypothetical protein